MVKVFLNKEDVQAFKAELKENTNISQEVIDSIVEGYYFIEEDSIRRVSKLEYYSNSLATNSVYSSGLVSGLLCATLVNSDLRTSRYSSINSKGKATGHGEAFEDINNRKLRDEGHKVNSQIGKSYEYGGPDAIIDGNQKIQYKCFTKAEDAANNIAKHHSYPNQIIYVNSDIVEQVVQILRNKEEEGTAVKGTADRVRDSGISIEEAKKVARAWTMESLSFDARTAVTTGVVIFIVTFTTAVAGTIFLKKEKITKKDIFKWLGTGAALAAVGMGLHILFNQTSR